MAVNNLDLARVYSAGEQIKGLRSQNALAQMTMKNKQEFSALAPKIAAGDKAATLAGAAIAPQDTTAIMTAVSKMGEAERARMKANYEEIGKAAAWADTPEKWNQAIDFLNSKAGGGFEQYRGQFASREMIFNNVREVSDILGKGKAQSPIGKLKADLDAGLMSPEQYNAAIVKANAPRGPLVKIENQAQTIDNKLLDMDLETISGTRDSVKAGEDFMPRLEVIVQGLESGNVETGRWQEATLPIRQWAQSAGWADDPTLGEQEAVLAAISYMIPRMRVVGSGQTSDVEIKLFSQATAQYSNTPQGNILIARTMMQLQGRNKELLAAQRAWLRKSKTLEGFDADAEIGPMFPKVAGQEEADKLPFGTVFIYTPNGRFMVKQ